MKRVRVNERLLGKFAVSAALASLLLLTGRARAADSSAALRSGLTVRAGDFGFVSRA